METRKIEGILLQTIPYLGAQRILKIFTAEAELLSLIAKSKNPTWTTPFCIAEWVYKKGQSEIHALKDGTLLDPLLELRNDYEILRAAGQMAQDLLHSQLPSKKGGDLYALTHAYLKKLPLFAKPLILAASFRLKILLFEGLLSLEKECSVCRSPASYLSLGESLCSAHSSFPRTPFSDLEWEQLHFLAYARQFSQLLAMQSAPLEKIDQLFQERLKN